MSVIVDRNATFKIEFKYIENKNSDGKVISIDIVDDVETANIFSGDFINASFDMISEAKEEATVINHINEKSMLRYKIFVPVLLSMVCKSWNLTVENGNKIPIDKNVFSAMHSNFCEEIFKRWCKITKQHIIEEPTDEMFLQFYNKLLNDLLLRIKEMDEKNNG